MCSSCSPNVLSVRLIIPPCRAPPPPVALPFFSQGNVRVQKMLVGNKSDLPNREVTYKEAKAFADGLGIPFAETSAKGNDGVIETFNDVVALIKSAHESAPPSAHQPTTVRAM